MKNVSDRGTMATTCNLSVYLPLLTTLYVSAHFLSLGRHCLCRFFVAVSCHKLLELHFKSFVPVRPIS